MDYLTYRYATNEAEAQQVAQQERALGRRAYVLQLRADHFEIRSWK